MTERSDATDALEDWAPETSFAWGQQRSADPRAHRASGLGTTQRARPGGRTR